MKLYPYQEEAVNHAISMIAERGNSLIVAGTGAGKTIMMAATIGKFFKGFRAEHRRNPHVLVLVHRTEIHTQNHSKFSKVCPDITTSEITSKRKSLKGYIHFGMLQTVTNIIPELEKSRSYFDLIVIDEAHHAAASTYMDIVDWNTKGNHNAAILGVTATPNRGDKLPLINLFDNFYQITVKFLIESHYLVRPRFVDLSPVYDLGEKAEKGHLLKNCKADEEGNALLDAMILQYLDVKEPGQSIIFAPSHEFCRRIYDKLKALGRNPSYLWSGIDDDSRKEELKKFEEGEAQELINVDICTEGYDYPALRNLVDFDTNGTHGQWVQKVGRVLRTTPGKTSCTVIDFGGNIELYPDGIEAEVNLEGAVKKKKGMKLSEDDFFKEPQKKEKPTPKLICQDEREFSPYHLPKGFESVNDHNFGIVYTACGSKRDTIIVGGGDEFLLYVGNKQEIQKCFAGEFNECIQRALSVLGSVDVTDKPITNIQIKMLAPEYPTMTLNYYTANCCICWKAWKNVISEVEKGGVLGG